MSYQKCDNCGKEFPDNEIENHKLYCLYTLQQKEMENLIPCEICNSFIDFDSYNQHISTCGLTNLFPIQRFNINSSSKRSSL